MAAEVIFLVIYMEHYYNNPVENARTAPELRLYRPKINYFKATFFVIANVLFSIGITFLYFYLNGHKDNIWHYTLKYFWVALLFTLILTSRFSCIWFVRLYQKYAKSETRLRCFMTPSCSDYAILAFKKYGTLIGGVKAIKRLLRCHPPGEVDYP